MKSQGTIWGAAGKLGGAIALCVCALALLVPAVALADQATYTSYSVASSQTALAPDAVQTVTLRVHMGGPVTVPGDPSTELAVSVGGLTVADLQRPVDYEADGNDLVITIYANSEFTADYDGELQVLATTAGHLLSTVLVNGKPAQWNDITTVIPSGFALTQTASTVGTATTPASVTMNVSQVAAIRGMVMILPLSNGAPILSGGGFGVGAYAIHAHMFLTLKPTDYTGMMASNGAASLAAAGYTITSNGDGTVTLADTTAKAGEVLDIAVYDDTFLQANGLAFGETVTGASSAAAFPANAPYSIAVANKAAAPDDGQMLTITATFPGPVTVSSDSSTDPSTELGISIAGSTTTDLVRPVDYQADGNDLVITVYPNEFFTANYAAQLDVTATAGATLAGVTVGGQPVKWTDLHTVIPTGLAVTKTENVVGSATTPASVTVQVSHVALVRSMIQIMALADGKPIVTGGPFALGFAVHSHMFYSQNAANYALMMVQNGGASLTAAGYTITNTNDTVTLTDNTPKAGEVLDIAVYDDTFLQANDLVLGAPVALPYTVADLSACTVKPIASPAFTGGWLTPAVVVTDQWGNTLVSGTDYTTAYSNNKYAGTATVTITGAGHYTGSTTAHFTIAPKSFTSPDVTVAAIADKLYTGARIKPTVTVSDGATTLVLGSDYSVTYGANTALGQGTVTVNGVGDYTGTKTATFNIVNTIDVAKANVALAFTSAPYVGTALTPAAVVSYDGRILQAATDYTIAYANNVNPGQATVTITGMGAYTGTQVVDFTIAKASIATATVTAIANQVYTGSAISPAVAVSLGGKALTAGSDYTVTCTHNVAPGKARVVITGIGDYTGTVTPSVTFCIVPGRAAFAKVVAGAKRATLTWKANPGVDGYQVVCAAGASTTFKSLGVVSGLAKTVRGLKTGVTYHFMVRAFKVIDGRRYYGAWSTARSVKVK